MKRFGTICAFCVLFLVLCLSCTTKPVTLVVLQTTDLHGRFDTSMAAMAGYVREQRSVYGNRLLLFDTGDYLQGTPGLYYSSHVDTAGKHLCAAFFDWFPYTAVTVGNHDIEAGMTVFSRVYRQMATPVLSANIVHKSSGEPFFTPYRVFRIQGRKIAVLGLLTPHVSSWVAERLRPGLVFQSIEASAKYWIPLIREREKPDLLIGLFHTGAQGGAGGPLGSENAARWIAEHVNGIDLICYGHDHRQAVDYVVNVNQDTVWLMNPGAYGKNLARAEITLSSGKNRQIRVHAGLVNVSVLEPDQEYLEDFARYFQQARTYEQQPVAEMLSTMKSHVVFEGPSSWVDEIHRGQLEIAGLHTDILPEISFASALTSNAVIEKGQLYLKDFFTWFPYENSLCIVVMTGHEIRRYLEYSCEQTSVIDFDTAAGILYTVYRDRPAGERVEIHGLASGFDFSPERKYHVVLNSYRAQGGGGHLFRGLGWDASTAKDRIVWESPTEIRKIFMQWEASRSPFDPAPLNHWQYQ